MSRANFIVFFTLLVLAKHVSANIKHCELIKDNKQKTLHIAVINALGKVANRDGTAKIEAWQFINEKNQYQISVKKQSAIYLSSWKLLKKTVKTKKNRTFVCIELGFEKENA